MSLHKMFVRYLLLHFSMEFYEIWIFMWLFGLSNITSKKNSRIFSPETDTASNILKNDLLHNGVVPGSPGERLRDIPLPNVPLVFG